MNLIVSLGEILSTHRKCVHKLGWGGNKLVLASFYKLQMLQAAAAMDTLRTFIVTHTPEVMNSFVEMQQKLAAAYDRINRSTCSTNGDKKDLSEFFPRSQKSRRKEKRSATP